MQQHVVAIVGAGNLGKALAFAFSKRPDITVRTWDRDPARNPDGQSLRETVVGAHAAFLCVPSWVHAAVLRDVTPLLSRTTVVVSMAKGIDGERSRFMPELLDAALPTGQGWAIMGGPMLAAEISEGRVGVGVVAAPSGAVCERVLEYFRGTNVVVEASDDIIGLTLMGVLKNVYAMGLGIAEALEWEGNARGWFVSRALRESSAIVSRAGGKTATVLGPAGVADLVATGFSTHSRNRTFGRALVMGGVCPADSEGCASLPHLLKRVGDGTKGLWLLEAITEVVVNGRDARGVFEGLIATA